jgi:hypothetical protein
MWLQAFDELNENSIGGGGSNTSDALPERLGFLAQKRDALLPQSRRCGIDIRYPKRETVDSHMVQSSKQDRLHPWTRVPTIAPDRGAGRGQFGAHFGSA